MTIDAAQRFAALGAELLARAPIAAYRGVDHVALDPITLAQPGFCGIDYRGLTIVGLNPGRGTGDAAARLRRWNDAYMRWRDSGWSGYEEALGYWKSDIERWRVWNQWIAPVLSVAGVSADEIAYLNLVKVPTANDQKPTVRLLDVDWPWTRQQLELLDPTIVLAGGVAVSDEIRKRWPSIPFELITQNRARSQNTRTREEQARGIGLAINRAIT